MYGGDAIAGSTLSPFFAHVVDTEAVPQMPLVGTATDKMHDEIYKSLGARTTLA